MWLFHTGIIQLQRQEFQIMNDSKGYLANCTLVYALLYLLERIASLNPL
jgi:hypothetical protein